MRLLLATLALIVVPPVAADGSTTVTLQLTPAYHALLPIKTCEVTVPSGGDGGDVLDAAAASGCISGWSYDRYGTARFVTCIDGLCAQPGTFWAFYVNEAMPDGGSSGIDDVHPVDGDVVEFAYVDWFSPFLLP